MKKSNGLSDREKRIALTGAYIGYSLADQGKIIIDHDELFDKCAKAAKKVRK